MTISLGCFFGSDLGLRLFNMNRMLFIAPIDVARMRFELSGIMHWMNPVMPCLLSSSFGRINFTSSFRIFLSLLSEFVSLNPGVSMRVNNPVFAGLQTPVTDLKDYLCSKWTAWSPLAKFFWYNFEIFERDVDLPYPHSPIVMSVNGLCID